MGEGIDARNFLFGLGTELLVHIGRLETKLSSTLVGVKRGKYLLIESPEVSGIEAALYDGNRMAVIFIHSGTVYGFKSIILNIVDRPSRLIFISYPDSIQSHELRESQRMNCYLPAVIEVGADESGCEGVILDISRLGCNFSTVFVSEENSNVFGLGSKVKLGFRLSEAEERTVLSGRIRNLNMDEKITSLGIQFDELNEEMQAKIDAYINRSS